MNKEELFSKLSEIKANECPIGRLGRSIIVSKNVSEDLIVAKSWNWDCHKVNDPKHGWRSYEFIFNNEMVVEKVIIHRIFDSM